MVELVAGLDDAGRGSVIGPLVVAGVLFIREKLGLLRNIGVKDSKLLSPMQRFRLADKIRSLALEFKLIEVNPKEIDQVVFEGKKMFRLNWLEAKTMAQIIEELKPDIAYVDASDVNAERFGEWIKNLLSKKIEVVSEHGADLRWPVVSAASILAKTHRDNVVSELRNVSGDFGSGYPSDPKTVEFLRKWFQNRGDYPEFIRRSWKTIRKVKLEPRVEQKELKSYLT